MGGYVNKDGLYTSGAFAKMNATSKKTLRVYEEMGLLVPAVIDESSGYRFYTLDQCSTLDAIQQIQDLGASLAEIKAVFEAGNLDALKELAQQKTALLEEEMTRIQLAQYNTKKILQHFREMERSAIVDTVIFEHRPERFILSFPILNERAQNLLYLSGKEYLREWEMNLRLTKQYMIEQGLPLELFHSVGCRISRDNLCKGNLVLSGSFIFIDDEHLAAKFGAERLTEGICLTMYKDSYVTSKGTTTEVEGVQAMRDFARSMNLVIVGDYYGEIIADTPAFLYSGREMLYKLQFRVSPNTQR